MRTKSLLFVALSSLASIPLAHADDWYQDPSYSFEQMYFGALAGSANTNYNVHVVADNNIPPLDDSTSFSDSQLLGGVNMGYAASWDRWYMGLELSSQPFFLNSSKDWTGNSNIAYDSKVEAMDFFNADLLPGFYLTHNTVLYLRGGVAAGLVKLKQNNFFGQNYDEDDTTYGPQLGAGLNVAFTPNFSLGLDYIYTKFNTATFDINNPTTGSSEFRARAYTNEIALHFRYSFNFGGDNMLT